MSITVYNPFGTDMAEINESTAGERIGKRIKKIREEHTPKMTQADLGAAIGLDKRRIQQYESGTRKPKMDIAEKIADALGVETSALLDPVPDSYIGVMYAFFEMEHRYGLTVEKEEDGRLYLRFRPEENVSYSAIEQITEGLEAWYQRKSERDAELEEVDSKDQVNDIIHRYHMWEWTFPIDLTINKPEALEKNDKGEDDISSEELRKLVREMKKSIEKSDRQREETQKKVDAAVKAMEELGIKDDED